MGSCRVHRCLLRTLMVAGVADLMGDERLLESGARFFVSFVADIRRELGNWGLGLGDHDA
jgi:hypothetical protein